MRYVVAVLLVLLAAPEASAQRTFAWPDSSAIEFVADAYLSTSATLEHMGLDLPGAPEAARGAGTVTIEPGEGAEADNAMAMAYTPDGTRLLSAGWMSQNIVAHDAASGIFLGAVDLGSSPAALAATDDEVVAALPLTGEVVIMDLTTLSIRHRVALTGEPTVVVIAPDDESAWVATIGLTQAERRVARVDLASGEVSEVFPSPTALLGGVNYVDTPRFRFYFSPVLATPDGEALVLAGMEGVEIRNARTGALLQDVSLPGSVYGLALSTNGQTIAVAGGPDGAPFVGFVDRASGEVVLETLPPGLARSVALSGDGQRIIAAAITGSYFVKRGESAVQLPISNQFTIPLGLDRAAVSGNGGNFGVFDLQSGDLLESEPDVRALVFASPADGSRWAAAEFLETLHLRGGTSPVIIPLGEDAEADAPRMVAIDPTGTRAAVSMLLSDNVLIVDLESLEIVSRLEAGFPKPRGVHYLPDGRLAVGYDGTLAIFDPETGDIVRSAVTPGHDNQHIFSTPSGDRILSHSHASGRTLLYQELGGTLLQLGDYPSYGAVTFSNVTFQTQPYAGLSPTGRWFATLDPFEGDIRFRDVYFGRETVIGVPSDPQHIAFNASGDRAFVTTNSGSASLINLESSPSLLAATSLPGPGGAVAYDESGDRFVVVSRTFPVRVYSISAQTGSVLSTQQLSTEAFFTSVVAAGERVFLSGARRDGGGLLVEGEDATDLVGVPAEVAYSAATGTIVAAIPGPDAVELVQIVSTAAETPPEAQPLALRAGPIPSTGPVDLWLDLEASGEIALTVFDARGREVMAWREAHAAGHVRLRWDGHDAAGQAAPAGVYIVRVLAGNQTARARIVLAR